MALLRDLDGFCAAREHAPAAVRTRRHRMRLSRFIQGLSGRALALSRRHVRAHRHRNRLPAGAQWPRCRPQDGNRRLYKATAALLWAQTRYGTFGTATVDIAAALARWPDRERALRWFAALEAVRLEAVLGAELPGLAAEIAAAARPLAAGIARGRCASVGRPDAAVSHSLTFLAECMAAMPNRRLPHAGAIDLEAALRVRAARIARDSETRAQARCPP
jgi:nitric oxide reductase NorD protein